MLRSRSGSSAMEWVLVAALVTGAILLGLSSLSDVVTRTADQISNLESSPGSRPAASKTVDATLARAKVPAATVSTHVITQFVLMAMLIAGIGLQAFMSLGKTQPRDLETVACSANTTKLSELSVGLFQKRQEMLHNLIEAAAQQRLSQITVREIMSSRVTIVPPETKVAQLVKIIKEQQRHHLLVCTADRQLLGVISDRDLSHRRGRTAADLMTRKVHSVAPETDMIQAVTLMINARISALPIIQNERLIGVLTTRDLMMTAQCLILLQRAENQDTL